MQQSPRHFAKRLNDCLDDTGAPSSPRDRAVILSKMLDIPKQQAWCLIEGQQFPETTILTKIANEFEVDQAWLLGEK